LEPKNGAIEETQKKINNLVIIEVLYFKGLMVKKYNLAHQ